MLILLLMVIAPAYFIWTDSAILGDLGGDSAVYVLSARHYADTATAAGVDIAAEYEKGSQFPPLYPLLLAVTGSSDNFRTAHAVTTGCLLLALLALYGWYCEIGIGYTSATLLVAAFAMLRGTGEQSLLLHSESLCLLLSVLSLLSIARFVRTEAMRWAYMAACLIALAIMTRTVATALLAPLVFASFRRPVLALRLLAIPFAAMIAWSIVHASGRGYSQSLWQTYGGAGFSGIGARLYENAIALWWGVLANFLQMTTLSWVIALLAVLVITACLFAFQCRYAVLYCAAYFAILLIWPFPAEAPRFMWLLIPVLLGIAQLRLGSLQGTGAARILTLLLPLMIITIALPEVLLTVQRFNAARQGNYPLEVRHLREWYEPDPEEAEAKAVEHLLFVASMQKVSALVPVKDCVFSIKPALVALYSQRRSRPPPPENSTDADFWKEVVNGKCPYVLMLNMHSPSFADLYPLDRLGNAMEPVMPAVYMPGANDAPVAVLGRIVTNR